MKVPSDGSQNLQLPLLKTFKLPPLPKPLIVIIKELQAPPHHKTKRKKKWKKPFPSLLPPFEPFLFFPPILSLFTSLSSYTHFFHPQAFITCKLLWSPPFQLCSSTSLFWLLLFSLAPILSHAQLFSNPHAHTHKYEQYEKERKQQNTMEFSNGRHARCIMGWRGA